MQHQSWLNPINSLVNLQDGATGESWCSRTASLPSDCLSPQLNSAVFIWRLYGSVTGTLPASQSTQNTWALCSPHPVHTHTHASQLSAILNPRLPDWRHFVSSFEWRPVFGWCVCVCVSLYIQSTVCLCINSCSEIDVKLWKVTLCFWMADW